MFRKDRRSIQADPHRRVKTKRGFNRSRFHYPPWESAFSLDSLNRAWLTVRANKGASGDGETIAQFDSQLKNNLRLLRTELLSQTYRPKGVKQILVPKNEPGWRPLTLWAVRDRLVQRAVYDYLEPVWDPRFLPCSFGYRRGLSTLSVMQVIRIARQAGNNWVLDADIKDCFGSMQNSRIASSLGHWRVPRPLQKLIIFWLNASVLNVWGGRRKTAGTSQGGVISPLLCNLYLHDFDKKMQNRRWQLIRYADDFLLLADSRKAVDAARRHADSNLKRISLNLHPQKTRVTSFEAGFQFVGWFFVRDECYQLR